MRIPTDYVVNKTHSHRSRQAAAPHPHTLRQVLDFSSLRKCFIMNDSAQHADKCASYSQSMQVQYTCAHLDDASNGYLSVQKPKL